MNRRHFVGLCAIAPVCAAAAEPTETFGSLASALSERDAENFIRQFDSGMPGLDVLRENVEALVSQADVISSLDFVGRKDEGGEAVLQVDWALTLQSRSGAAGGPTERRRRVLTARLKQSGASWVITSLEPLDFFRPPRFS